MSTKTYRVPCMVTANVTLSEAGEARVEEYVNQIVASASYISPEEARHKVLLGLVDWMGVQGRRPEQVDGWADLSEDDVKVSREDWQPSYVEDVEEVSGG